MLDLFIVLMLLITVYSVGRSNGFRAGIKRGETMGRLGGILEKYQEENDFWRTVSEFDAEIKAEKNA